MRRISTAILATSAAVLLAACGTTPEPDKAATPKTTAAQAPTISPDAKASARAAAGLPPEPSADTRKAYLDALNAIDPRIVKPGKEDQAVSRGINQCSSIKSTPDDRDKLVKLALDRFTITTRLPDINTPDTGGKILDVVHKNLCPTF